MTRLRPSLVPAWLLLAAAFCLFVRPLACKGGAPLVLVPDDGPLYMDSWAGQWAGRRRWWRRRLSRPTGVARSAMDVVPGR